ncbi:type II toxin-antitoxin system RelE/ParE family toxin [Empedobacter sedimenti]|uniref:type II toxin-antitoxin system RelE/ParE family toxin n=1 Tax=Empedobacter sedimenti TaxID=3042610 RepID=UPI0024A74025|nr:type II toxin-antitoxin system RelE/ParE family toxin [Empedobacter sedimenti]
MAEKVIWTTQAKNELFDILDYWKNRNQSILYSQKLFQLIQNQINLIVLFPEIGRKTNFENVRIKIIKDYLLFYEVKNSKLYILTIKSSKQNPSKFRIK